MQPIFEPSVARWLKKNPRIAIEFRREHLPLILANPYVAGTKLSGKGNYYSYHFQRRPEYRAVYSIDHSYVIIIIIGPRESVYKDLKHLK